MVTGQAGGALRTMAVLQAYNTDLLKDLYEGKCLSSEAKAWFAAFGELIPHRPKFFPSTLSGRATHLSRVFQVDSPLSLFLAVSPIKALNRWSTSLYPLSLVR